MEKNYYDILQVNKNASPEVIEKVYKLLAKKYHPDLQDLENKQQSEEILKKINEAYEVLSNPEKKAIYDKTLENIYVPREEYYKLYNQNLTLKKELNDLKTYYDEFLNNLQINNLQINNLQNNITKYNNFSQITNSKNNIKRKLEYNNITTRQYSFKNIVIRFVKNLLALFLTIIILILLLQVPTIKNFFINNPLIKIIIDLFF